MGVLMDLVDEIISDWSKERPDIDCSGKEIVGRMLRFYSRYILTVERALKKLKIAPNVFSVLVTIRRKGPQAEINVKDIIPGVLITSGAMSNLLTRLVNTGLVSKRQGTLDARSMLVQLTPKGLALIDEAMEIQAACERKLTQTLTDDEKFQLSQLLRQVLPEDHFYVE